MKLVIVLAVLFALGFASGCSTQGKPEVAGDQAESTSTAFTGKAVARWACSPEQRPVFVTDPGVPRSQPLAEVASEFDGATFHIDSNDGTNATVAFLSQEGLIVQRVDFHRGQSHGWRVERGQRCLINEPSAHRPDSAADPSHQVTQSVGTSHSPFALFSARPRTQRHERSRYGEAATLVDERPDGLTHRC